MSAIAVDRNSMSDRAKALGLDDVRACRRRLAARCLTDAIAGSTSSQAQEAMRLGVDKSMLRDWCNGSKPIHLDRVACLRNDVARRTLTLLAEALDGSSGGCVEGHTRRVTAAVGVLNAELDAALADGKLDEAERVRLRQVALQLLEAGQKLLGSV